jgi:hypothetical protein
MNRYVMDRELGINNDQNIFQHLEVADLLNVIEAYGPESDIGLQAIRELREQEYIFTEEDILESIAHEWNSMAFNMERDQGIRYLYKAVVKDKTLKMKHVNDTNSVIAVFKIKDKSFVNSYDDEIVFPFGEYYNELMNVYLMNIHEQNSFESSEFSIWNHLKYRYPYDVLSEQLDVDY